MNGLVDYLLRVAPTDEEGHSSLSPGKLRTIGYALFFWASVYATPPSLDTPDGLVFGLVLLAVGILVRIPQGRNGWHWFVLFGMVLGLGYLAKAVMFVVSFVFLGVLLFATGNVRRAATGVAMALASFLLIAGPFAGALSKSKGRLTFGDAGRINYAEYVNGVKPFVHWQGGPTGAGMPIHPTRQILHDPPVYEFSSPLSGTYPPGTDQSYWYEGVRPHFELRGQLLALRLTLNEYFRISTQLGSVLAVFLVLLFSSGRVDDCGRSFLRLYYLWGPALATVGRYALVHAELRFLGAFILLFWAAAFLALRIPQSSSARAMTHAGTVAIVLLIGAQIMRPMSNNVLRLLVVRDFPASEIVQQLRRAGIEAGDRIACLGVMPDDHYWAHLAGVTIVAEVPPEEFSSYLAAGAKRKTETLMALAQPDVKAIVARDLPRGSAEDGWQQMANTNYSVLVLHK